MPGAIREFPTRYKLLVFAVSEDLSGFRAYVDKRGAENLLRQALQSLGPQQKEMLGILYNRAIADAESRGDLIGAAKHANHALERSVLESDERLVDVLWRGMEMAQALGLFHTAILFSKRVPWLPLARKRELYAAEIKHHIAIGTLGGLGLLAKEGGISMGELADMLAADIANPDTKLVRS